MMAVCAGLLAGGCSRAPLAPKPQTVYVDSAALARFHPQWKDVDALDGEIAWLTAYRPAAATPAEIAAVSGVIPATPGMEVDTGALRARIASTLDTVRARERDALERRLERARRRERAAGVSAERAALEDEADRRFQAVLDQFGAEMANLDVRISVTAALERTYAARGAHWEALAKQTAEQQVGLREQLTAARARRTDAVNDVFKWLEDQFRLKALAEEEAAAAYRLAHQRELDLLDAGIEEQKQLLLAGLRDARGAEPGTAGGVLAPATLAANVPTLPPARLEARIAALRARRAALAAFVLQNTQAVVKSVAAKLDPPVQPLFAPPAAGVPDRTDVFRGAVQNPPAALERLS